MLLSALYLVLSDSRRLEVIVVAFAIGALGAIAPAIVRGHRDVVLRPRPRWILGSLRGFLGWPRDLLALVRALIVRPEGRIVEEPFEATGEGPHAAARRALAVAGGSLAPNSIVVGIDPDRGLLLRHELMRERP